MLLDANEPNLWFKKREQKKCRLENTIDRTDRQTNQFFFCDLA